MIGERRRLPPKIHWVTYGLQGLSTEKFLEVVQKILEGKLILLKPPKAISMEPELIENKRVAEPEKNSEELENIEECFLTRI